MFLINEYLNLFLDFIFPKRCYFCKSTGNYICRNCKKNLNINLVQRCHVCGKEVRLGFVHSDCKDSTYLDGLIYVVLYDGAIKTMIKDVKYHFYYDILNEISEIMADHISKYNFDKILYTSVPLHWKKKNYRGFNQAELLSRKVAKRTKKEYSELLIRKRNTIAQASLGREDRENNLKEVFDYVGEWNLNERSIILVDDVFTTGSTLNECAKVLKHFGARQVYGFCFAKSRE